MSDNPYESPIEVVRDSIVQNPKGQSRLGLLLTLFNAACWVIALSLAPTLGRNEVAASVAGIVLLIMSLPLALPFVLPSCSLAPPPTAGDVILSIGAIAANSAIWGYGLAWLINRGRSLYNSQRP